MDVSIIIVNYNTSDLLDQCICSVAEKVSGLFYEIIVVDNASSDNSVFLMKEKYPSVTLIESKTNLGFGKANNLGASFAKGKYLFLLNTDTLMINNAVKVLFDFMEEKNSSNIGGCGGNLFHLNLTPNFSYSLNFPTLKNIFIYRSRLSFLYNNEWFNYSNSVKDVSVIIGADFFVRKELYESIGGFDPSFFMYVEDTELCYRIKQMNYRIVCVPDAKIIHLQGKSSSNAFKLEMEFLGYLIYFKKYYPSSTIKLYKSIELFFALLRAAFFQLTFNTKKVWIIENL